ncbi:hypothetical protein L873DRAFT_1849199 [Choiromyces venosus 120613-1]|uniref:Myb/SANT-like DNA-binding domain-containing protein n=1 Tax=Choiromyces venosus 120613-1 TaxID=1336337 RepID=A0A3N4IUP3_9PEZI|nr:hypothetical protein L873DRAFT_1849199 [Choiromyces venosus 120613-1]
MNPQMPRNYSEHSYWNQEETGKLIEWLEELENLAKTKKGSRMPKKIEIVCELATRVPMKSEVKVGHKYDNMIKSYREAAKLNNQSGWDLTEQDFTKEKRLFIGCSRHFSFGICLFKIGYISYFIYILPAMDLSPRVPTSK